MRLFTFPTKWVVFWTALLSFIILTAEIIGFIVCGIFSFHKYTYWNLIITNVFLLWAAISVLTEGWPLKILILFYYPLAISSNFVVVILINIILLNNGYLFVVGSVFGRGSMSIGEIHLGDFLMHNLPFFMLLFVLVAGFIDYVRLVVKTYVRDELSIVSSMVYSLYWFVGPFAFSLIYLAFFNPVEEYYLSLPLPVWIAIGLFLVLLYQFIHMCWIFAEPHGTVTLPVFVERRAHDI